MVTVLSSKAMAVPYVCSLLVVAVVFGVLLSRRRFNLEGMETVGAYCCDAYGRGHANVICAWALLMSDGVILELGRVLSHEEDWEATPHQGAMAHWRRVR